MEKNARLKEKEKSEDVEIAVYRIIEVPPNVEGVTKSATIQFVPKSEIDDNDDDEDDDDDDDDDSIQSITRNGITFTSSFVIDEDSSVKHSTTQVIRVPVDVHGRQSKCIDVIDVIGNGSERHFSCCICKKSFKHSSHLKRHINTHTGERTYKCDLCDKTFLDASTLSRHRKIHSGDKPWSCKICKKSFGTLGSLRRHITVHNQEGRPYQCETCLKRFPDNSSYQKHKFIHTGIKPHVCDICGKAFVHVGDLNGHRKIHVEVKPYNCERCGKDFAKHSNYARHLLIHEGDKEFSCSICGVSYNFQSSLTRHILTHVRGGKETVKSISDEKPVSPQLNEDDPDADVTDESKIEIVVDDKDRFKKTVKVTRTKMKQLNKIKQLNKLQELRKSGKLKIKDKKPVVHDQNSNPNSSITEQVVEVDCDPTVLPAQDVNTLKQTTTEDVSSLLTVPEDFGSTKNFPDPLLEEMLEPGTKTEEYILPSDELDDRSGSDSVIAIISLSDQVNLETVDDGDAGVSGIEDTSVLLAVLEDNETILPDNSNVGKISVSEAGEVRSNSNSGYLPVKPEFKNDEILLLKKAANLVLSKDTSE